MKPIVALPFRHQASFVCDEAREMLIWARGSNDVTSVGKRACVPEV